MLEDQGYSNPNANTADDPPDYNRRQADTDIISISDATDSSDVISLLAPAFSLMGNYPEVKDAADAYMMALDQT